MHPFLPQQKLFKAYDIRGDVRYFTDDFLWSLGQSFAQLFTANSSVVIGYDVRLQSENIAKILAYQLIQHGIDVVWLGQVTTPMMAYFASHNTGSGLIVTASHSERHINGIKWLVNHESPSSQDIADLFDSLADTSVDLPSANLLEKIHHYPLAVTLDLTAYQNGIHSALTQINANLYFSKNNIHDTSGLSENPFVLSWSKDRIFFHGSTLRSATSCEAMLLTPRTENQTPIYNNFAKFKLVIDCLNGATSRFAKSIFTSLGYDCVVLNDTPDGNFPKGNPDPTEAGRLTELCQTVIEQKADIGLAFDGDGDRLMVVDSEGNVVAPDHLLYLLANLAIQEKPTKPNSLSPFLPAVIFDVKCSHHLPILIEQQGGLPLMEKTGSSLMRKSLQNKSQNAIFAGELSGHFLFNDGYFVLHDDAMYAGIRLLHWLSYQEKSLADIVADLPVSVSTADMYLPIETAEVGQNFVANLINKAKNALTPTSDNVLDEYANPILAQANYQTPLTEFLPKQKVKQKKSKKLPFFTKPMPQATVVPQKITTIDGLRVDFPQGFGILRKSNTGNFLTVRFAGNTLADLRHIQQIFVALCQSIDEKLAKQVAMIEPQHF